MWKLRRDRVINERRRVRVVRCWYTLHVVAVVAVISGVLIANDPPANVGLAIGPSLWLGTFAASSVLLVTVGLTGVYERTSPAMVTKSIAGGIAALTGLPFYGLGLVSTPILVLLGVLLRLAVTLVFSTPQYADSTNLSVTLDESTFSVKL